MDNTYNKPGSKVFPNNQVRRRDNALTPTGPAHYQCQHSVHINNGDDGDDDVLPLEDDRKPIYYLEDC